MYIPEFGEAKPLRRVKVFENLQIRKISNAPFLPLSLSAIANFLKWDLAEDQSGGAVTDEDATLTLVATAVRDWWENHTGISVLRATWEQTQDAIKDGCVALRRGPVVGVTSVKTILGFTGTDATPATLSSSLYTLVGNEVYSEAWPTHRGKGSVVVRYTAGVVDWAAVDLTAPTAPEILTAQALVPNNHRLGMLNTIGHLLENREGAKSMSKYEVDAKLSGLTPPNSELVAVGVSNLSLSGKCWR